MHIQFALVEKEEGVTVNEVTPRTDIYQARGHRNRKKRPYVEIG